MCSCFHNIVLADVIGLFTMPKFGDLQCPCVCIIKTGNVHSVYSYHAEENMVPNEGFCVSGDEAALMAN